MAKLNQFDVYAILLEIFPTILLLLKKSKTSKISRRDILAAIKVVVDDILEQES